MSGWVAGAIVVGSVASGVIGADAAKSAARTQAQAADSASAEQRRQYDQTREDWAPWRAAGESALNRLTSASTGDMSGFYKDPAYDWQRSEGLRGVQQSAAARGGLKSGNALKALSEYNQNLAKSSYGDWWNRQAGLAGIGQNATAATSAAGQNAANNISNNLMAAGDARASGIMGAANSWSNSINSGVNNFLLQQGGYFGSPKTTTTKAPTMAQGNNWMSNRGSAWMGSYKF